MPTDDFLDTGCRVLEEALRKVDLKVHKGEFLAQVEPPGSKVTIGVLVLTEDTEENMKIKVEEAVRSTSALFVLSER